MTRDGTNYVIPAQAGIPAYAGMTVCLKQLVLGTESSNEGEEGDDGPGAFEDDEGDGIDQVRADAGKDPASDVQQQIDPVVGFQLPDGEEEKSQEDQEYSGCIDDVFNRHT